MDLTPDPMSSTGYGLVSTGGEITRTVNAKVPCVQINCRSDGRKRFCGVATPAFVNAKDEWAQAHEGTLGLGTVELQVQCRDLLTDEGQQLGWTDVLCVIIVILQ